ncbi:MAG: hypothetical protein AAGG48_00590 [Planctomycetota bacterium]
MHRWSRVVFVVARLPGKDSIQLAGNVRSNAGSEEITTESEAFLYRADPANKTFTLDGDYRTDWKQPRSVTQFPSIETTIRSVAINEGLIKGDGVVRIRDLAADAVVGLDRRDWKLRDWKLRDWKLRDWKLRDWTAVVHYQRTHAADEAFITHGSDSRR